MYWIISRGKLNGKEVLLVPFPSISCERSQGLNQGKKLLKLTNFHAVLMKAIITSVLTAH